MFSGFNISAEKQDSLSLTILLWPLQCDWKQKKNITQNLLRISFKEQACQTTNSFNTKILVKTLAQESREILKVYFLWTSISLQWLKTVIYSKVCHSVVCSYFSFALINIFLPRKTDVRDLTCEKVNHWFIRKRAFIEIWSSRGVWRARKMHTLASWVLSKLPKCFISRWTHRWRMNQLFYNIFNPVGNFFLEGFVCWRHERA